MVRGKSSGLSHRTMAYYGLPHLLHSMVILPLVLFIPSFYADDLGLPLASVGMAIAASRILDVITDPLIGILSDRIKTRWGKRKPWMAVGTPILALSTWMVFVPGDNASVNYLLIWTCLLFLTFTIFDLPYKAWGAELSFDYHERSRIAAWRAAFGSAGHVLFLSLLMVLTFSGLVQNSEQLRMIAILVIIGLPILVIIALAKVPETPSVSHWELGIFTGFKLMFRNRAFLRTLAALLLFGTGLAIQATLHKLILTHVVGEADYFSGMILVETCGSVLALPLWIRLSYRFGKHRALTLAGLWIGFWSLMLPIVGEGDLMLYMLLIVLRGSSLAAIIFLSNSIAADVVDHDIVASGVQRTGLYFSLWGMTVKMAIAFGVLLATVLPSYYGFVPAQETTHNAETLSILMRIYGWLPGFFMLMGFPFLWHFPIDRKQQQILRQQIDQSQINDREVD